MSNLYKVSSNPHVRDNNTTTSIMLDVIIALIPATIFGVYNAGENALHAALLILVCVGSAVFFEFIFQKGMKQTVTISDMSAAVTGLLLALNLPSTFPIWMAIIGSAFAIIVIKQLYGGIGQNFMNPALGARCFLVLSFGVRMTTFVYDGVTGPTPLAVLKTNGEVDSVKEMFIGTIGGTIGETSVIALLIGASYLLIKKVIDFRIPFFYILSFSIFIVLFGDKTFDILIDEKLLVTENLVGKWSQDKFINQEYKIPAEVLNGKKEITVRFQPKDNNATGKIFYIRLLNPE